MVNKITINYLFKICWMMKLPIGESNTMRIQYVVIAQKYTLV